MTNRIKISIIAVFVLFALFLYLDLSISNPVLGASSSVTIAAPTGVTASDGDYVTKVGINWHTMRGARLYRIYRNTCLLYTSRCV